MKEIRKLNIKQKKWSQNGTPASPAKRRGVARLFKMRGRQEGLTSERGGGADWD